MARRHQRRFDRLGRRVVGGPGALAAGVRRAAFGRDIASLPEDLRIYVGKVHDHAYRVVDDDVEALLIAGYTEDEVFEATVAAAVGAGLSRLEQARRAVDGL